MRIPIFLHPSQPWILLFSLKLLFIVSVEIMIGLWSELFFFSGVLEFKSYPYTAEINSSPKGFLPFSRTLRTYHRLPVLDGKRALRHDLTPCLLNLVVWWHWPWCWNPIHGLCDLGEEFNWLYYDLFMYVCQVQFLPMWIGYCFEYSNPW